MINDTTDAQRSLAGRIATLGPARNYPKRAIVFQEGDRTNQIFVVLSGHVKIFLADGDGREIVINELGPGQFFGEMSLDGEPRSASVMTTEPSRLAIVEREAFRRYLAADPDAAFELLVTVIRRTRNATRVAGNLALMDVYGRLARLLLDLAKPDGDLLVIGERLTQQELAIRVGATREMVARVLADMRESGHVTIEKDRMVIHRQLPARR